MPSPRRPATCTRAGRARASQRHAIRCPSSSASVPRYAPCERRILFAPHEEHEAADAQWIDHERRQDPELRPRQLDAMPGKRRDAEDDGERANDAGERAEPARAAYRLVI